jgi:hypothetical protein
MTIRPSGMIPCFFLFFRPPYKYSESGPCTRGPWQSVPSLYFNKCLRVEIYIYIRSRILERTVSLIFLGIILRVLRLEVSVYNVYITNQFKPLLLGGGGGGWNSLVEGTVNSKDERLLSQSRPRIWPPVTKCSVRARACIIPRLNLKKTIRDRSARVGLPWHQLKKTKKFNWSNICLTLCIFRCLLRWAREWSLERSGRPVPHPLFRIK